MIASVLPSPIALYCTPSLIFANKKTFSCRKKWKTAVLSKILQVPSTDTHFFYGMHKFTFQEIDTIKFARQMILNLFKRFRKILLQEVKKNQQKESIARLKLRGK